jgi:uncharacterized metal-binding protein
LTVVIFGAIYLYSTYVDGKVPGLADVFAVWRDLGTAIRLSLGPHFLLAIFLGLWLGAASHTFTDMAGSWIKTGRVGEFL